MQTMVSAVLSFIILAQSFSVSLADFLHIPDLINHYEYHQETFGDDVFTFLNKHYGELKAQHDTENQEEREDHEKLPTGHQHSCVHTAVVFLGTEVFESDYKSIPADQTSANYFYHDTYNFSVVTGIFQPPKNV